MIRLADYVVDQLYRSGGKYIFMVTGRGILYLSDAVARHEGIQSVAVHHEQSAAFAAYAYAQCTENIGVCLVSTGCASANAISGVLNAWQDGVPCVFISGQNMLAETTYYTGLPIRTYGSQEANIVELVKPITKYAVMITKPDAIAYEIEKALYLACSGKKGPVWIDIPIDVQNMRIHEEKLCHFSEVTEDTKCADDTDIEYCVKALQKADRPVVMIGSGIRSANAIDSLKRFLEQHPMPLVYSPSAVDTIGAAVEYSIGAVGSLGGSRAGNFTIQNADLILVIGSRLSAMTIGQPYEKFARAAHIIVVDIDVEEHKKGLIPIQKIIQSDANEFLLQMNQKSWEKDTNNWLKQSIHWK